MKKIFVIALMHLSIVMKGTCQQTLSSNSSGNDASPARVYLSGTGGTDALNFDKLTASGGFKVLLILSETKVWNLQTSFNFSGDIKNEKADSVQLSSIYFPDIGSSSFLAAMEFAINKKLTQRNTHWDYLVVGELSFQKRNISKDSSNYHFSIQNLDLGLRVRWTHESEDARNKLVATFTAFPYNQISVIQNSEKTFSTIFSDSYYDHEKLPTKFSGWSTLFSVEFNDAMIYFRSFKDYKSQGDYYFTVGIKATGKFFSF